MASLRKNQTNKFASKSSNTTAQDKATRVAMINKNEKKSLKYNLAIGASCAVVVLISLILIQLVNAEHHEEHHEQHHHHEEHKHHKFHPYKYGYKVIDHKGNKQWKQEESHTPMEVKGSYGYKDKHGLFREVTYIADKHGFRAHVKTNEPGTAKKNPAAVKMDAHPDPSHHHNHHKSHHESHESHHGHH